MTKEEEILTLLQEECAEVIQAVSKVRRFGHKENGVELAKEIGDTLLIMYLAVNRLQYLKDFDYEYHGKLKEEKLKKFTGLYS